MSEFKKAKRTRHPINHVGEIGNETLENLTDGLIAILLTAKYSRRYNPIREDELSTSYGRYLHSWLREILELTPFGISYISEDETGKDVNVDLGNGEVKESKLYATAGVYALNHHQKGSIFTRDVGIVASFKDLIKVYSLRNRLKRNNPRWDNLGMTIKQKRRDTEQWDYTSGRGVKSGRPIVYSDITDSCDPLLAKDLEFTGFPCYFDNNQGVLCPVDKESK